MMSGMVTVLQRSPQGLLPCMVLTITILLHVTPASGRIFNFIHSAHLNGNLFTKGIRGQAVVASTLDCARQCTTDPLCISFIYDDVNRSCYVYNKGHDVADDCVDHGDQNYIYYIKLVAPTKTPAAATTTAAAPSSAPVPMSLWAGSVVDFSSQFGSIDWSAQKIVGPSDVYPAYGDDPNAWASAEWTAIEWIEVQISQSLYITQVDIYETYHAGGVKVVSAWNPSTSSWDVLWQVSTVSVLTTSRIFSPPIQTPTYKTDQLRIEVDCGPANDWVELDAVEVTGYA